MTYCRTLALVITALLTITASVLAQKAPRADIMTADPGIQVLDKSGALPANKNKARQLETPTNELITAGTYGFTATSAIPLENMASGTTQLVGGNIDDGISVITNIGFDFWYDGVRFTQFSCNTNGVCRLGATVVGTTFTNSLGSTTDAPKIAPYFDDQWSGVNGKVHYKVTGLAPNRKLIVEWQNQQIPRNANGFNGAGTFQMWLFETSGVIEFVYGSGIVLNSLNAGYSVGLQSGGATNFASVTTLSNSVSYAAANNTQSDPITAGTAYIFTPNVPAAPSNNLVSPITPTSLTLNWLDNATNEVAYIVYRSTDNVNFFLVGQTAANIITFTDNNLVPNTMYFYTVQAVSEGALSTITSFGATTAAGGSKACIGGGGLWSNAAIWGGTTPLATENVTIPSGCAVTIDTAATALSVTVQSGGSLVFDAAGAQSLTTGSNVTIDSGGSFSSAATGTVTTHVLSVGGNLTNNGTLDFSTNGDTAGAGITFSAGPTNASFGGSGLTTDVRTITVAKGAQSVVVELNPTNFTVRGVATDVAGYLTLTSGTFKISGIFAMTNRTFPGPTYVIPALGGFWLNNPNYVVAATASGTTTGNSGLLRLTQGTYGIGLTGADGFQNGAAGGSYIIEGGTLNANGRFDPQSTLSYTQSAGIVNVAIVGNTVASFGSFELFGSANTINITGGTINLVNPSTAATKDDYVLRGGGSGSPVPILSGGTVVFGSGAPGGSTFVTPFGTTFTPNVIVNTGMIWNINAVAAFHRGPSMVNNGTITSTGAGRLDFNSQTGPMSYSGTGTIGTIAAPFASIGANSLFMTTLTAPIVTSRVNLFTGGFTGSGLITLGNLGASTTVVQTGSAGLTTPGGTFDVTPVHNAGTGGHIYISAFETILRSITNEVPPTRILTSMSVDNVSNLDIGTGDLILSSAAAAATMTNGEIRTGPGNNLILSSGTATVTRTNGYVAGNFRKTYTVVASKVFEVGQNGFSPVTINVTAATAFPITMTARAFDNTLAGFSPAQSISRNWQLEEGGDVTATLTFVYFTDAADVNGTEANYRVWRRDAAGVATDMCGAPCIVPATNTAGPVAGVTQFSRWTVAEAITPTSAEANISGRVLTSNGMPIANVKVVLTGGELASPVIVYTGHLGYYSFEALPVGHDYVITVKSRRFFFTNPSHLLNLQDSVFDADFIADPDGSRMRPGK